MEAGTREKDRKNGGGTDRQENEGVMQERGGRRRARQTIKDAVRGIGSNHEGKRRTISRLSRYSADSDWLVDLWTGMSCLY